jgi:hypothetical protein
MERAPISGQWPPLRSLLGLPVRDGDGAYLGRVVARVIRDDAVDVLVRRRHLLRRSEYRRIPAEALRARGQGLVYQRSGLRKVRLRPSRGLRIHRGDTA